jgi:hypothetical protein
VFNTVPNTSKVDESIDFIGKSSSLQEGVRVIGRKWGGKQKYMRNPRKSQEMAMEKEKDWILMNERRR